MSMPINELASLQDQFQLIALKNEMEDENAMRFNANFKIFAEELKMNNQAMSDRILILEKENAIAKANEEALAQSQRKEINALNENINLITNDNTLLRAEVKRLKNNEIIFERDLSERETAAKSEEAQGWPLSCWSFSSASFYRALNQKNQKKYVDMRSLFDIDEKK